MEKTSRKEAFKIFNINGDYIVALSQAEAIKEYLSRVDDCTEDDLGIEEISPDKQCCFETDICWLFETFAEFLGKDFKYTKPQVICWNN